MMPVLSAVRRVTEYGRQVVKADVLLDDGRTGCVSVAAEEHAEFGDAILEHQAEALERRSRSHGYRQAEPDRFAELR